MNKHGSIIAAEVALGWESARIHERTGTTFRRDPLAWDNTLPFVSKITCNKVVRLFQGLFGDARAEACWLPYFSVACSLTDAHTITHRTGTLWRSACARAVRCRDSARR
jgi:predicted acylesterase/phospholipase RssA